MKHSSLFINGENMNKELKDAIYNMIYDLDKHFPDEILTNEYYEWFIQKYIKPILDAGNWG